MLFDEVVNLAVLFFVDPVSVCFWYVTSFSLILFGGGGSSEDGEVFVSLSFGSPHWQYGLLSSFFVLIIMMFLMAIW